MIRNYIITTLRIIQRSPVYFGINLIGLSIGIICCLLIALFVQHELSFDQFHSRKDRLYRLNYNVIMGANQTISPSVPVFVAPHLKRLFPEVEDATRFMSTFSAVTVNSGDDKLFDERGFAWADPNFFRIMDFEIVSGNFDDLLTRPKTLVLSETTARKYFGDENPVGKTLTVGGQDAYEVTGVMEDVPGNSHFTFELVTSMYSLKNIDDESIQWNNPNYTTFVLLKPGTSRDDLQKKINEWVNPPGETTTAGGNTLTLPLEPLSEVHFNTSVFNFQGKLAITDVRYLYIFTAIALLVLSIACINYINLATARASARAKEVGIRKTSGAGFRQLIFQYLSESFLLLLPAVVLSILIVNMLLPFLGNMLAKEIEFNMMQPEFLLLLLGGWAMLSVLAGFYPALVLSRFRPITVLKGNVTSSRGVALRKALVIVQFTISAVLMVGTLVVLSQLQFMMTKKLGMDKEQVVMIRSNRDLNPKLRVFTEKLKTLPGVEEACAAWRSPFETVVGNGFNLSANPGNDGWVVVGGIAADEDYIKTLDIELLQGRNFDPAKIKDTVNEFIVNEAFLRDFGLTAEEAVGKQVSLGLVMEHGPGSIVGVVKDFHFSSLHQQIGPIVLFNSTDFLNGTLVRLSKGDPRQALAAIETEWKALVPQRPFNYTFLDDQYDAMYRTEQRVAALAGIFAGIAVAVACLGLLALASFTAVQRAKEISIRKVLGATSGGIVLLLSKGYVRLMLIAFIAAVPISYFLLNRWLENFAFRISVGPWYFIQALIALAVFALVTVGYQSYRASVANPAENLRQD